MKMKAMDNKTLKTIGLVTLAAGALYYPAMKLYQYIRSRRSAGEEMPETTMKSFAPSYRGKHNPHHRHAPQQNHNHNHNGELA
ncbi:MAG: hypothetical protein EOP51_11315 [Sphingobacteriales bacterium]|nr:MAG: hypothetical protein EOP51_11315 [Sphingobacteriales bacterium]